MSPRTAPEFGGEGVLAVACLRHTTGVALAGFGGEQGLRYLDRTRLAFLGRGSPAKRDRWE